MIRILILICLITLGCNSKKNSNQEVKLDENQQLIPPKDIVSIDLDSSFHLVKETGDSLAYLRIYERDGKSVSIFTYCRAMDSIERSPRNLWSYAEIFPEVDASAIGIQKRRTSISTNVDGEKGTLTTEKNDFLFFELIVDRFGEEGYYLQISALDLDEKSAKLLKESITTVQLLHKK